MRFIIVLVASLYSSLVFAKTSVHVEITLPAIKADPYFKPYVAVWIEDEMRNPVHALALWYQVSKGNAAQEDGKKWLKDLRQWWRKIGRPESLDFDGVTGATRRPGTYSLVWEVPSALQVALNDKSLVLHVEAAREEGGRSYKRIVIDPSRRDEIKVDSSETKKSNAELEQVRIQIRST